MEKDKLESLLIDYIDGRLNEEERKMVDDVLQNDEEARRLYQQLSVLLNVMAESRIAPPSLKGAQQFDALLRNEIKQNATGMVISLSWFYRVAAAVALILVGGGVGYWISQQQKQEAQMLAIQHELEMTRQLVMSKINNEQSASQRILGVQAAYEVEAADHEITNALIKVMNEDANSNVRLAAINALAKFSADDNVRKALIASLNVQTDPVVQITLIQLMIQMKEKGAVKSLQQIINDEQTLPAVKDEAYAGIFKLT